MAASCQLAGRQMSSSPQEPDPFISSMEVWIFGIGAGSMSRRTLISTDPVGKEDIMTVTSPLRTRCPSSLVSAIRAGVGQHADWQRTASLVAAALRRHLPGPQILTAEERLGDPDDYRCHVLHVGAGRVVLGDRDGLAARPGYPFHDHVTWCVFGVVQGTEFEELYRLSGTQVTWSRSAAPATTAARSAASPRPATSTGSATRASRPLSRCMSTARTSPGWAAASAGPTTFPWRSRPGRDARPASRGASGQPACSQPSVRVSSSSQ